MDNELAGMTTQQKSQLGCRRILRCLAHLSKELPFVGIQDLQKCYFRLYKREFNKEECRSLFGLRNVMPIFQKFMADTVYVKTDLSKTGSLYFELKCSIEEAMGEENFAEDLVQFEAASNTVDLVKKVAVSQSNGTKTKSKAKIGATPKTPPKLMLDILDNEDEEDKKVEEVEKNSLKSGKEGRGIMPNEKVQQEKPKKEEEFKKSDRPHTHSKAEDKLVGALEDDGEEEVDNFEGDNNEEEEDEGLDDDEEGEEYYDEEEEYEYDDEEEQYPEEEEEETVKEKEKKLKTHLELLATIFVYVRMESPLKVTELFGRLLSKNSPKNFKSPIDLIKFVQSNNCDDAIIVQKCGNEDFLFWNDEAAGVMSSAVGHVMQKLGKILMDSPNGK